MLNSYDIIRKEGGLVKANPYSGFFDNFEDIYSKQILSERTGIDILLKKNPMLYTCVIGCYEYFLVVISDFDGKHTSEQHVKGRFWSGKDALYKTVYVVLRGLETNNLINFFRTHGKNAKIKVSGIDKWRTEPATSNIFGQCILDLNNHPQPMEFL